MEVSIKRRITTNSVSPKFLQNTLENVIFDPQVSRIHSCLKTIFYKFVAFLQILQFIFFMLAIMAQPLQSLCKLV